MPILSILGGPLAIFKSAKFIIILVSLLSFIGIIIFLWYDYKSLQAIREQLTNVVNQQNEIIELQQKLIVAERSFNDNDIKAITAALTASANYATEFEKEVATIKELSKNAEPNSCSIPASVDYIFDRMQQRSTN